MLGYISEDPASNIEEHYLKNAMPITKQVSPKYHKLFEKVCTNLGFDFGNISPFLVSDPRVNAACIALGGGKYLIYLTSSLVQIMNEDEVAFVIGHEIGHAIFEHHKLPVHGILANDDRLKPQDTLQVLRWSRMAEISADRVGLIGCQSLQHAFGAKIVLSSRLASSNFLLEIDNYASNAASIIERLIKSESYEDIYSTHPFNPLRINSLYLFHQSKELFEKFNFGSNKFELEYISREIRNLINLMDGQNLETDKKDSSKESKNKEKKQDKDKLSLDISDEDSLLLWAAVLVSTKNSNLENDELECISTLFSSEEISIILNRLNLQEDIYSYAKDKFEENLDSFKNYRHHQDVE